MSRPCSRVRMDNRMFCKDEQVQRWAMTGYLICASVVTQKGIGDRQRTAARIFGGKGRSRTRVERGKSKMPTTFEDIYRDEVTQCSGRRFASVRSNVCHSSRSRAGISGSNRSETGRRAAVTERTRRHRRMVLVRSFRHLEPRRRPRSHPRRGEMVDTHAVGRGCECRHRTRRRRRQRRAEEERRRWCPFSTRYSSRCRYRSRRRQPGASRAA